MRSTPNNARGWELLGWWTVGYLAAFAGIWLLVNERQVTAAEGWAVRAVSGQELAACALAAAVWLFAAWRIPPPSGVGRSLDEKTRQKTFKDNGVVVGSES
jgi:hypothetical protein